MLREPKEGGPLQQGDIIADVPFLVLPKAFSIKAQGAPGQTRLDSQNPDSFQAVKQFGGDRGLTAAEIPLVLQLGMVVTQSCDLDYKDQVTLARVFPLSQLVQAAREAIDLNEPLVLFDVVRRLTEGSEFNHLVYLGDPAGTGPQVADLLRVQSFSKEWKPTFQQRRLKCLTDEGLKYLQGRLGTFTGRFATALGFWYTEEHQKLAQQLEQDRTALRAAYDRLHAKRQKPAGP